MNARRGFELVVGPAVVLSIIVATAVILEPRLPDPLARHWDLAGAPDGASPLWLITTWAVLAWTVAWAALLWTATRPGVDGLVKRVTTTSVYALAGFLVMLFVATLFANLDVAQWRDATLATGRVMAAASVAAGLFALTGWWLGGGRPAAATTTTPADEMELVAGEAVVWAGTATNGVLRAGWPIAVVGLGLVLMSGLLLGPTGARGLIGAVVAVVAIAALAVCSHVAVTVGANGLVARLGPVHLPRVRIPLDEVDDASVVHVEPISWGGWGYRMWPGVRAVVVRRGEGIRVSCRGRADLIVTVDDAARGAGALLAHRDRARRAT